MRTRSIAIEILRCILGTQEPLPDGGLPVVLAVDPDYALAEAGGFFRQRQPKEDGKNPYKDRYLHSSLYLYLYLYLHLYLSISFKSLYLYLYLYLHTLTPDVYQNPVEMEYILGSHDP